MRISDWSSDVGASDLLVVERAGLNKAIHPVERRLVAQLLHELQVNELEPFRGRGHVHAVLQPGEVITHPGNDISPRLLSLDRDRTRDVSGTRVSVRVDLGGRRIFKHKRTHNQK